MYYDTAPARLALKLNTAFITLGSQYQFNSDILAPRSFGAPDAEFLRDEDRVVVGMRGRCRIRAVLQRFSASCLEIAAV